MTDDVDGSARIRIELDDSGVPAEARALGDRIATAINGQINGIGGSIERQLRAVRVQIQVSPDLTRFEVELLAGLRDPGSINVPRPDLAPYRFKMAAHGLSCCFADWSACSVVLIDHACDGSPTLDPCGGQGDDVRVVQGSELIATSVGPVPVEVARIRTQGFLGVAPVKDQQAVGALAPGRAYGALRVRAAVRAARRGLGHRDALTGEDRVEGGGGLRIPVPYEVGEVGGAVAELP